MSNNSQHLYEFGPFHLDTMERQLRRDGEPVPLTPKVFETLCLLVERGGHLVEKDELMKRLWPDSFVEEGNLTNNISTLRKILGEGPNGGRYIETVPKRGYRFTAPIRELQDDGADLILEKHSLTRIVTEEETESGSHLEADAMPAQKPVAAILAKRRHVGWARPSAVVMVIAVLFVAGATTAFGLYWLISQRQPRDAAIATLPFSKMEISRLTTSGKITHAAISPDGKYVAHVTLDAEGDSLWVRHVAAPAGVRVAGPAASEYVSVKFAPGGDWLYYVALDRDKGDTMLYRVPVLGGPSSEVAYDVYPIDFSPDGSRIAYLRMDKEVSRLLVANADGSGERTLATRRQPELFRGFWNAPAWSPDGRTIACQVRLKDERGQYETVIGIGVEDGTQTPLTKERWSYAGQPVWLADGSGLLVTAYESETGPSQVWHISRESGQASRVTNDLNDYHDLSLTADSGRLAAVQKHSISGIWVAPEGDAGRARQIATESGWIRELAWTPDGRIVYRSNAGGTAEIWMINADGSNPKQVTTGARASRGLSVSPDGRYIFFASERAGRYNIWRVDKDGSNLKQLTDGNDDYYPHSTPDGQWVVFQRGLMEPRLWKAPAGGGQSVQLTATRAQLPHASPDGRMIAYYYLDPDVDKSRWRIGVVSLEGGPPLYRFDLPPTVAPEGRVVRWSPERQAIAFVNNPADLSDIWLQPLDGSQPKQLTNFKAEQIIAFDWSRDGRTLAFVRGVETSDVVLIDNAALK